VFLQAVTQKPTESFHRFWYGPGCVMCHLCCASLNTAFAGLMLSVVSFRTWSTQPSNIGRSDPVTVQQ